jgi:hypothetical protein
MNSGPNQDVGPEFNLQYYKKKKEATSSSLRKWMDKQRVVHLGNAHNSMLAGNKKTYRKFKCVSLSERSQYEKDTYGTIPTIW